MIAGGAGDLYCRGRAGAVAFQPVNQLRYTAFPGDVERRLLVVADPIRIRTLLEKILCHYPLPAATGVPERVCDLLRCRWRLHRDLPSDGVQQAQCGSLPDGR